LFLCSLPVRNKRKDAFLAHFFVCTGTVPVPSTIFSEICRFLQFQAHGDDDQVVSYARGLATNQLIQQVAKSQKMVTYPGKKVKVAKNGYGDRDGHFPE